MESEEIHLTFAEATGAPGDLVVSLEELIKTKLAIQANSGYGKSRALRQLYEQTFNRMQQFVFDVEGEFLSLREKFDYLLVGAPADGADLAIHVEQAAELCRRLMELRASCIFDLSALEGRSEQRRFVQGFLEQLMKLPKEFWRPVLIGIDEAQIFVPERGFSEAESTAAVISVAGLGRKRGYCLVLAFQRLSQVHKGALAECLNRMIGRTVVDTDLTRAARDLGMDRAASGRLKKMARGEFYTYGPAFGDDISLVRTGDVQTSHFSGVDASHYTAPAASDAVRALLAQLQNITDEPTQETPPVPLCKHSDGVAANLTPGPVQIQIREVPVLAPEDLDCLRASVQTLEAALLTISNQLEAVRSSMERIEMIPADPIPCREPPPVIPERPVPKQLPVHEARSETSTVVPLPKPAIAEKQKEREIELPSGERLSTPQQAILDALMDFWSLGLNSVSRSNVAIWSGASPTSSAYGNNLGRLRSLGLVDYPQSGAVALTQSGRKRAKSVAKPVSSADLLEAWCRRLSGPQGRILRHVAKIYPASVGRNQLASATGASSTSSAFGNNLGGLRSLGLIDYPQSGRVSATRSLFPAGIPK
jgi:Helicase HerA, central domain